MTETPHQVRERANFAEQFADGREQPLAGIDGQHAAELLAGAKEDGTHIFARACETAVRRLLASGQPLEAGVLFDENELQEIAEALARGIATADLLGRARIHRRAEMAERAAALQPVQSFADWRGPFRGERGGRYWLPAGAEDVEANRQYGDKPPGEASSTPAASTSEPGAGNTPPASAARLEAVRQAAERIPFVRQRLDEEGGGPYDTWATDEDGFPAFRFNTSGGKRYDVIAAPGEEPVPNMEIIFADANRNVAVTGAGNAHEVFGKVTAAVAALVKKMKPRVMTFSAAEPSRQRLYDRLTQTLTALDPGYAAFSYGTPGGGRVYVVAQRPRLAEVQAALDQKSRENLRVLVHSELIPEAWFFAEGWTETALFAEGDANNPFPDLPRPLPPMQPEQAVNYFNRLVPTLGSSVLRYGPRLDRHAFTLAVASDQVLLDRVKAAIIRQLREGPTATPDVQEILDDAGVSTRNPQYAEMVVRTNVMDAFNQGSQDELTDPAMQEQFPAWEYLGVLDSRTGSDHRPKIGKYYPSSVPFAEVRGPRVFNCRCSFAPIHKSLLRGVRIEQTW